VFAQCLLTLKFIFSISNGKLLSVCFQATIYITKGLLRTLVLRTSKFEAVQKSPNVLPKELTDRPARISSLNDSIKSSETLFRLVA